MEGMVNTIKARLWMKGKEAVNKRFVLMWFADTFTHGLFVFNGIREPFGVVQGGSSASCQSVLRMKYSD